LQPCFDLFREKKKENFKVERSPKWGTGIDHLHILKKDDTLLLTDMPGVQHIKMMRA